MKLIKRVVQSTRLGPISLIFHYDMVYIEETHRIGKNLVFCGYLVNRSIDFFLGIFQIIIVLTFDLGRKKISP